MGKYEAAGTATDQMSLMAGMFALPVLFVGVLLLPGYGRSTRIAAFTYAFLPRLLMLIAIALQFLLGVMAVLFGGFARESNHR